MAVESLFFGRNVTTALTVGQARGVLLLAAAQAGLPIYEYKPAEVKQALAGYGAADKRQMQEMVRILLDLDDIPRPDDAADAVAVAICHLHSARLQRLMDERGIAYARRHVRTLQTFQRSVYRVNVPTLHRTRSYDCIRRRSYPCRDQRRPCR